MNSCISKLVYNSIEFLTEESNYMYVEPKFKRMFEICTVPLDELQEQLHYAVFENEKTKWVTGIN